MMMMRIEIVVSKEEEEEEENIEAYFVCADSTSHVRWQKMLSLLVVCKAKSYFKDDENDAESFFVIVAEGDRGKCKQKHIL